MSSGARLSIGLALVAGLAAASLTMASDRPSVASAAEGDPCPNAQLRAGLSSRLPDCRAYEMVSPLDKNGGAIDRDELRAGNLATSAAAPSGEAVAYAARAQFAGIEAGVDIGQYRSVRTDSGWTTQGLNPPLAPDASTNVNRSYVSAFSLDLSQAVVLAQTELVPGARHLLNGSSGLYLQAKTPAATTYRLLSKPSAPLPPDGDVTSRVTRFDFAAATPTMDRVVFNGELARPLTPDVPTGDTFQTVYEWADGAVRQVSVLPPELAGAEFREAVAGARPTSRGFDSPGEHPLSEDGRRIFFTASYIISAGLGGEGLFVREDGLRTLRVSAPERTGTDPNTGKGVFQAARAGDGALALFTSADQLVDGATSGTDLYLWDANAPEGARLTDLTTADPTGGGVLGVVATTKDLSHVYFAATGDLAPGATGGAFNLYRWTAAEGISHLATLGAEDGAVWSTSRNNDIVPGGVRGRYRDARISDDGDVLLFTSHESLTGDDTAGFEQVYRLDMRKPMSQRLVCLSCGDPGTPSSADAELFPITGRNDLVSPLSLPRNLSRDGSRVVFETTERLLPSDANGASDVYGWNESTGLSLISSGTDPGGAEFIDASASGSDVFFTTRARLVPGDTDHLVDVYDARVGGGFAGPTSIECTGDTCQGESSQGPPAASPGSAAYVGPGNPARTRGPRNCARFVKRALRKLERAQRVNTRPVTNAGKQGRQARKQVLKLRRQARTLKKKARRCERGESS